LGPARGNIGFVLSAIIVNHRSSRLVNGCIRALLAGTVVPDEVVVIDNEATDGALDPDLADGPVRLIRIASNPGYAAACNTGAAAARGDLLLFLNPDVTVSDGCVERCVAALATDPSIGVVGPRLERPDGRLDHACHRGLPTPMASFAYKLRLHRLMPGSRRLSRYTMAWLDPRTDHDIEACSGAFLLIRRDVLETVGGWDERYRFYAEDLDLCLRVGARGLRVRYLGTVTATHLKGALSHHGMADGSLSASQREVKRWAQREIIASHRLFFQEHLRQGARLPVRLLIDAMFALQSIRLDAVERLSGT
jgi:GT2 family glycosyltransferase